MRARRLITGGAITAVTALAAVALGIMRALPLAAEHPQNDGGSSKKRDKMDMKKKGNGPRTRRKKAKKGK